MSPAQQYKEQYIHHFLELVQMSDPHVNQLLCFSSQEYMARYQGDMWCMHNLVQSNTFQEIQSSNILKLLEHNLTFITTSTT